jgi:hypothetical protein
LNSDRTAKNEAWAQQLITVSAFLGGTSFAALTFILQSPDRFKVQVGIVSGDEYFSLLITLMAAVSSLFVFASLMKMTIAAGWVNEETVYGKTGLWYFNVGVFGLLIVFPVLLFPFTWFGAMTILVIELVLLGILGFASRKI